MKAFERLRTVLSVYILVVIPHFALAKDIGGQGSGGGNTMKNGQTVDQYLYEHKLDKGLLLGLVKVDTDQLRERIPAFADLIESEVQKREYITLKFH